MEVLCCKCFGPARALLQTCTAIRYVCLSPTCDEPPFDIEPEGFDERPTQRRLPAPPDTEPDFGWASP